MSVGIRPEIPGRGAWTRRGGLLPAKPGTWGGLGFYRAAVPGEPIVGEIGGRYRPTYSQRAVHYGVRAIQRALSRPDDGILDADTGAAIHAFQQDHERATGRADGILGPNTATALWRPLVASTAARKGIPAWVLGGIVRHDSGMDPAAVGVNGTSTGLCQIDLSIHDVAMANACNPEFSFGWLCDQLNKTFESFDGKVETDIWEIVVAHRNSPVAARQWAHTGMAPRSSYRASRGFPQIDEYVRTIRHFGDVFL